MNEDKFSIKSRSDSFKYAFNGLASLLKQEHNARIHLAAAIAAVTAGIILRVNAIEWCLLFIVICLVFLTELLNTSLEALSDVVNLERNEKVRKAKDYAAGAVLISAMMAVLVGTIIFLPKLISLFKNFCWSTII